jgi:hypothetical protein
MDSPEVVGAGPLVGRVSLADLHHVADDGDREVGKPENCLELNVD